MKISLDWINDYVEVKDLDLDKLINKFTITTAEIEEVTHMDDDVIIEIDNKSITNRPDLWCHYGIAREISAITGRTLKPVDYIKAEQLKGQEENKLSIEVLDKTKCLRYSAIKLENINVTMSPEIIIKRLTNCGLRSINILVDLANYVMLDIGQPLHTFDERFADKIRVMSSKEAAQISTLDNVSRTVPPETLLICNEDKPIAIAGIIGGLESAVSESTSSIVLEAAVFDGVAIRKTSANLGLRTDASMRYEKFLDTEITTMAIGRYLKLLQQYEPQVKIASSLYDEVINPTRPLTISIDHKYIETYLGNNIERSRVTEILESLHFKVCYQDERYIIEVPTYRATKDITCKADIIEEILRVYGYDNIKGSPNKSVTTVVVKNEIKEMENNVKDLLVKKFAFNEIHSYCWYDNEWLKKLGKEYRETLKIINSSVKQFDKLKDDMAPNLLKIIYDNRKNYEEIKIFEIGRVFLLKDGDLTQPKHLAAAIYSNKDEENIYNYMKGICNHVIKKTKNHEAVYWEIKSSDKENCLNINCSGINIGYLYSIPSSILKLYSNKHSITIMDINLDLLNEVKEQEMKYKAISKYPETYLDFSILSPEDKKYNEIQSIVDEFNHDLVIRTSYIGTYIGNEERDKMKSTTIRMTIGDTNGTLQLEDINKLKELFIEHLVIMGFRLK